jgi:hypothetical protein
MLTGHPLESKFWLEKSHEHFKEGVHEIGAGISQRANTTVSGAKDIKDWLTKGDDLSRGFKAGWDWLTKPENLIGHSTTSSSSVRQDNNVQVHITGATDPHTTGLEVGKAIHDEILLAHQQMPAYH